MERGRVRKSDEPFRMAAQGSEIDALDDAGETESAAGNEHRGEPGIRNASLEFGSPPLVRASEVAPPLEQPGVELHFVALTKPAEPAKNQSAIAGTGRCDH